MEWREKCRKNSGKTNRKDDKSKEENIEWREQWLKKSQLKVARVCSSNGKQLEEQRDRELSIYRGSLNAPRQRASKDIVPFAQFGLENNKKDG